MSLEDGHEEYIDMAKQKHEINQNCGLPWDQCDYEFPHRHPGGSPGLTVEIKAGQEIPYPMGRSNPGIYPEVTHPAPGPWKLSPGRVIDMPDYRLTITESGITVDYGEQGFTVDAVTDEARYILAKVLPNMLERFLRKNEKYARAQTGHDLGVKGIVPDINRKSAVIIDRLWHDGHEVDESTEEVIDDLIGHLLLMKAKIGLGQRS